MFRSLSDHHQGDTLFVLTSVTKIIDVAARLLQCVCWVLSCPDRTRQDPTHTLQQACCYINNFSY